MIENLGKILAQFPDSLLVIVITNVTLILGFIIGKLVLFKFENAIKFLSVFTVLMSLVYVVYFIAILWFSISNLYTGNAAYAAMFPIFLFLPFIIGHFANYEKIHFFTNVQILTLVISLLLAFSFI